MLYLNNNVNKNQVQFPNKCPIISETKHQTYVQGVFLQRVSDSGCSFHDFIETRA